VTLVIVSRSRALRSAVVGDGPDASDDKAMVLIPFLDVMWPRRYLYSNTLI
jgi:hypothetical protein